MKTYFKNFLLLLAIALFFVSCQDEAIQIGEPNNEEVISPGSSLSNLMQQASANRTSDDDFLDNTSCFSVELPVTVVIGNITIVVENEAGLDELQDLLEEFEAEIPEFVFPITIISANYVETVIENQDQLEAIIENCVDDDVIECVDFVYPITFSVLNSEFVIVDTVTIENNEALYEFLESLDEDDSIDLVSLNFPVELVYANGETVTVNSNIELSDAISAADDDCDNYNDDDCEVDEVRNNLKECPWKIETYSSFPEFENFILHFNNDFTFGIQMNDQIVTEDYTWSIEDTDNGIIVTINSNFEDFGGEWLVVECDDDEYKFVKGDQIMEIEKDCEDDLDCDAEDLAEDILECYWFAGSTLLDNVDNKLIFTADGSVKVFSNNEFVIIGVWNIGVEGGVLTLVLDLNGDYEALSGVWEVTECHDGFYGLVKDNDILHLEQECFNNSNPFDCYPQNGVVLEECGENGDDVASFNIYEAVPNCDTDVPVIISFHLSLSGAENNTDILENATAYSNTSNPQVVYIKVALANNTEEFIVYPVELIVEDCTPLPFECFNNVAFELVECTIDNSNDLAEFNLVESTVLNINCDVEYDYSFHVTQIDADSNSNPISDPDVYLSQSATIYLRIEASNGDFEVYPVYLNAENCNAFDCFTSFDAVIEMCDEGNDGIEEFDLTTAYANCTPSVDSVSYYVSLADADAATNEILNPQTYTNTTSPQTIYVRAEANGQVEIFEILIKVVDCSSTDCTEADVDGILMDCEWKISAFNGDDHLVNYRLNFLNANELVITNLDTNETVVANWSTATDNLGNVIVTFDGVSAPDIQAIVGDWKIVECTANQLIFHAADDNNTQMVMDKICN